MNVIPFFSGEGPNIESDLASFLQYAKTFLDQYPSHENTIVFIIKLKIIGSARRILDGLISSGSEKSYNSRRSKGNNV
uniref:Uncharacterized protein n=1 Tax=Megaselia scalaris TaxID=36166 RepID=T1GLF0_MEGSC